MVEGLLDTNVFIHAQTTDHLSEECRRFLVAVERGEIRARLEPVVIHELSYALKRYRQQMTRDQIAEYLRTVLLWPGIHGETTVMLDAVDRWEQHPNIGFADAYLAALAAARAYSVYTKNIRHFTGPGVEVPDPLPDAEETS